MRKTFPLLFSLTKTLYKKMEKSVKKKPKLLVIMGPTGSGKSKLSIDLATKYFPSSEIINSDKIQLYKGLDITTNKIPSHDRRDVPHHLLGFANPNKDLSALQYRSKASNIISSIHRRKKIPILVGGSNSIIYALIAKKYIPGVDVFDETKPGLVCNELRYDCCFIFVDVVMPVLGKYLEKRVDEMLDSGMFKELARFFLDEGFGNNLVGVRKAIGVPEFENYFKEYLFDDGEKDSLRESVYNEAVGLVKSNTLKLAKRQVEKIERLRTSEGWEMNKVDATIAFKCVLNGNNEDNSFDCIWEKHVMEPSVKIVRQFLED